MTNLEKLLQIQTLVNDPVLNEYIGTLIDIELEYEDEEYAQQWRESLTQQQIDSI